MGPGVRQALLTGPEQDCQLAAPACMMAGPFTSLQSLLSSPLEHLQVPCASWRFAGDKPPREQPCRMSIVCQCKHVLLLQGQGKLCW